jgi:hypothetical protein
MTHLENHVSTRAKDKIPPVFPPAGPPERRIHDLVRDARGNPQSSSVPAETPSGTGGSEVTGTGEGEPGQLSCLRVG